MIRILHLDDLGDVIAAKRDGTDDGVCDAAISGWHDRFEKVSSAPCLCCPREVHDPNENAALVAIIGTHFLFVAGLCGECRDDEDVWARVTTALLPPEGTA